MRNIVISTNLKENGVLEIYHGNKLLCCVSDGRADEDFVEDILYGLGYQWNQDGTIIPLNYDKVKLAKHILETVAYMDMDEEQMKLVVEYELEIYKPKVDELREHTNSDEIIEHIHDWWLDYEIADETEDALIEYVRN